ncbi:putative DNA helicase [Medicago truncatula]|uniref:ATP-dependent DNA helicase n=1 Tax=Medicago truncatula TaxID=3880 RepID=A0A072UZI8_MEDTR|nr:probable ATP-dependent DNA helicase RecQ [Medicago truncatula]KEH34543.1 ATP-dependent DNA helicase RecQ [Medicago truncatula]RHN67990.1 putative DNA helicase [Medicago truncatula]
MDTTLSVLKDYFGFLSFRPYQREVIEKIIEKRDCLVVMATGSGKSLCYQVPPLVVKKTGIVVSPLISLMQDQVMALKQRGIKAEYLSSAQKDYTVQSKAERGQFDILFMTPEKACTIPTSFWSNLLKEGISLFAVDEAHCISEWGHDFRVEYKQLDKLRGVLLDVPYVGLTATATEKVRFDITNSLKMNNPYVVVGSFDRPNLFYGVKQFNRGQSFIDELVEEVSKEVANGCSTIIYCTTIKDVEQIYKSLTEVGINAGMYHGQMDGKSREESHRLFVRDEMQIMVATIAFGMGIDKPNIRKVIHYGCPKNLESYYQESGRCGRDGIASVCWLYYTRSDFAKGDFYAADLKSENQKRAVMESLLAAQQYCLSATCRRKFLLEHFGEKISAERCGNCDNCKVSKQQRDLSREAFLLMACIHSCNGRWGLNMPIDILRGSRAKKIMDAQYDKLPLHGLGKTYQANWWKALGHQLISLGYLKEVVRDTFRLISVSSKGEKFLASCRPDYQPPLVLPLVGELEEEENRSREEIKILPTSESEGFSEAEGQLYQMLLEERLKLAKSVGTAPYALCGDQTIKKIALTRPSSKARLALIDGVNQHLVTRYGEYFIQAIEKLSRELNLSLDGVPSIQTSEVRKVSPIVTNKSTKLSGAKFDAWKMWHEEGLSLQKIANFPGRSAPIQEQTVAQYLMDAAQEGLPFDWPRFCEAIGLKQDYISAIQAAIVKVGSADKLKPIKNELPEEITYPHIKAYLTMRTCGISLESIQSEGHQSVKDGEAVNNASNLSEPPLETRNLESHIEADISTESTMEIDEVASSGPVNGCQVQKLPLSCEEEFTSKRLKISETEEVNLIKLKATESSVVEWLKNHDEGATLTDMLEHFNGSNEDSIVELLNSLESDFLIYKKGNMYRAM